MMAKKEKIAQITIKGKFTDKEEEWILDNFPDLLKQSKVNVQTNLMRFEIIDTFEEEC